MHAAAVEIDAAPLAVRSVDRFSRILFKMDPSHVDLLQTISLSYDNGAATAEGFFELGNLVSFRKVGIEVVLTREAGKAGYLRTEGHAQFEGVLDSLFVGYRQSTGQTETDRAGMAVGRITVDIRTAAEHLRFGGELSVDLQSDDRLPLLEDDIDIIH